MTCIVFLRHFETEVDKNRPVAEWRLSTKGKQAMQQFLNDNSFRSIDRIYTSPEHKAHITAQAVAEKTEIPLIETGNLSEVDRSREGFIDSHDRYLEMVKDYLQNPTVPFRWENRENAEERIQDFLNEIDTSDDRIMAVTHGMFLATALSTISDTDPYPLWQQLGFGERIEIDRNDLVDALES